MRPLRVLVAEDSEDDFLLIEDELRTGGFAPQMQRVESADGMRRALAEQSWDIVLSDYSMPQFNAMDALAVLRASATPELPLVIVSGSIGEERAVGALKAGAANYVPKTNLPQLIPVIDRELKDVAIRRERKQAIEDMKEAIRARDEFLSIASHELKTPLTSVQLQAEKLARSVRRGDAPPEKMGAGLDAIVRGTQRLAGVIERLLEISRLRTTNVALSLHEVDLGAVVREAARRVRDTFDDLGAPLELRVPKDPVNGRWDRDRLDTVLANLLSNAAKFGLGKPVEVEVRDLGDEAVVRVTDHGIGIAETDQRRIFEQFERIVPERHGGGFGVGLWMCRKIVEAHGGRIELTSAVGEGSTFTVTLPRGAASP